MTVALLCTVAGAFGQTNPVREYVGLINETYHPDAVEYIKKQKEDLISKGMSSDSAEFFDEYLKGSSGSGFVYVADDGSNYVITNYHVINGSYTNSITFENQEGEKQIYENLRIIAADKDIDIAVLAFADDAKPFTNGLPFATGLLEEGSDVFAAGFPGLGRDVIWQFSRGVVSNASVKLPPEKDEAPNAAHLGPYIQHTAQIDPGNSGGPLLVRQQESTAGYAVVGINTLSARSRQAANFSIPSDRALAFIQQVLSGEAAVGTREKLDAQVKAFISGLNVPRTVFPHIAEYLSAHCVAANAEYAASEVADRASIAVKGDIQKTLVSDPITGMGYAVAWLLESDLRGEKGGSINASAGETTQNDDGSYTVSLQAGADTVDLLWVNENGVWKIEKAGEVVIGDKAVTAERLEKKAEKKKIEGSLRTDFGFGLFAGYANILDEGHAFTAALIGSGGDLGALDSNYTIQLIYAGKDHIQVALQFGLSYPIAINKIALMPFGNIGPDIVINPEGLKQPENYWEEQPELFEVSVAAQAGMMLTTAYVPGLFIKAAYQFNYYFMGREGQTHTIIAGLGWLF